MEVEILYSDKLNYGRIAKLPNCTGDVAQLVVPISTTSRCFYFFHFWSTCSIVLEQRIISNESNLSRPNIFRRFTSSCIILLYYKLHIVFYIYLYLTSAFLVTFINTFQYIVRSVLVTVLRINRPLFPDQFRINSSLTPGQIYNQYFFNSRPIWDQYFFNSRSI